MKVTVYNVKTGEAVQVHGVDALEYVASGGWQMSPSCPSEKPLKKAAKPRKKAVKKVVK